MKTGSQRCNWTDVREMPWAQRDLIKGEMILESSPSCRITDFKGIFQQTN
jgi:hypothetical protein